jgi:uncharacterized membrane protein YedE/YeeE
MRALAETIQANPALWLAGGGFLIGLAFGAMTYATNFCTMGALSDIRNLGDWRRFRAWILASAVALAGTQLIAAAGVVPIERSMYLGASFGWAGNIIGGLLFGFGMVLAGGCASRNLARAGGGDLRALLVLVVLGLSAYVAVGGILGPARAALDRTTAIELAGSQGLGDLVARVIGATAGSTRLALAAAITLAAVAYCFKDGDFRTSSKNVFAGLGVGLAAVAGWALTGLAVDDLADKPVSPISLTFVRPTGDAIEWLERYTAAPIPTFGVATVFGALLGAFLVALARGRFKVITFSDAGDTKRSLAGAVMMGIGGVTALGCTVGQAITGVSTMALGSFLTFAALVAGGLAGLTWLERRLMAEA